MDLIDRYLALAAQATAAIPAHLPPLTNTRDHFQLLTQAKEIYLLQDPARGWRLAYLVAEGSQSLGEGAVAQAYFQAAWCAAEWMQLDKVEEALALAEPYFQQVQAVGWLAACQWVRLAHPWILTGWPAIKEELASLFEPLGAHPETAFLLHHAQLSYAYTLLLTGDKSAAPFLDELIENTAEPLLLGRTYQFRSALLRRTAGLPQAREDKARALQLYTQVDSTVDMARGEVLNGLIAWQADSDCPTAVAAFDAALHTFQQLGIEPWEALTRANRAQVLRVQGQLTLAAADLDAAQNIYLRYSIVGALADSHIDAGLVQLEMGQTEIAQGHIAQALQLATQLGPENYLHSLGKVYQARIFTLRGDMQAALQQLEEISETALEKGELYAAGEALLDLARLWLQLEQNSAATAALEKAQVTIEAGTRTIYQLRLREVEAQVAQAIGALDAVTELLHAGVKAAMQLGHTPYTVRFLRHLGQHQLDQGQLVRAAESAARSLQLAREMGLVRDVTRGLLLQGELFARQGDMHAARGAWEEGLALAPSGDRELRARLYAALADVVSEEAALTYDEQALRHWAAVRQGFFQPWLASDYGSSSTTISGALQRGLSHGNAANLLTLVELAKGGSLQHRLRHRVEETLTAVPTAQLAARQQAVYAVLPAIQKASSWREKVRLQSEQVNALKAYDDLLNQRERALRQPRVTQLRTLDLPQLRRQLSTTWGDDWIALDYHLLETHILCLMVTTDDIRIYLTPLPMEGEEMRATAHPQRTARKLLSAWSNLLPPDLPNNLSTTDTPLIISPHGWLHHLPWPALPLSSLPGAPPLVSRCLPLVTPSLHILQLLESTQTNTPVSSGTVVSVPKFDNQNGRLHPSLPHAAREGDELSTLYGAAVTYLHSPHNRLADLQQHHASGELATADWLHLATHAFFNARLNGRACGLALADRDLWLADLEALAPLPPRIILSACSGIPVQVFEGDELVGLGISCLVAGAHTVVGNLWDVADAAAADLMLAVHQQWVGERPLAAAVAIAQRQAWQNAQPLEQWGGLQVLGLGI